MVVECKSTLFTDCDVVFSGLDSSVATEIEGEFRRAELQVFSNAKNYRDVDDVPLIVPLVNPEHFHIIQYQQKKLDLKKGYIVTNANCSTTGLVAALKPLNDAYGITQMNVVTLQAISGAGYPGISALDIVGNVIPYIDGEEDKIETEPLKILGTLNATNESFVPADFVIDATCNRVPVIDGHTECVSLKFKRKPESLDQVKGILSSYIPEVCNLGLYSAPKQAILLMDENDRPQPRLDLNAGKGYSVSVGRLREGNHWDLQFTLFSHNTILGAAGSAILNAEMALHMGYLKVEQQ